MKKIFFPQRETVLQAVFNSSFLNVFARFFGYLKHVVVATLLGFNLETDAFFLALGLIGFFLIFTDVFDSLGIPSLVKARQKSSKNFQSLTGILLTFTTILAVLITFLAFILSPIVINIAFGYDKLEKEILFSYYLFLIPYLFFNFFFHHFGAVHRSLRHFTVYFVGEFIWSFFTFLFTLIGLFLYLNPRLVLPVSIDLAIFIATIYLFLVSKDFWEFKFYLDETVKKILKEFLKLLIVYSILHIYMLVDRIFASYLTHKSITALTYGWMVAMIPRGLLKFENIVITSLSEVNAKWSKVNFYIKKLFLLGILLSLTLFIASPYLVDILFNYGEFSFIDFKLTITATQIYSFALPFVFLWPVIYKIYQIKEKILLLIIPIVLSIFVNTVLNYYFIFQLNKGIGGIALATDIAYFILVLASWIILKKEEKKSATMSDLRNKC